MTELVDEAMTELEPLIGVRAACRATGRAQSNHYRWHRKSPPPVRAAPGPARPQPRALSAAERQAVLDVLHQPRFVDEAPPPCTPPSSMRACTCVRAALEAELAHYRLSMAAVAANAASGKVGLVPVKLLG